jgi:two-component system phosphate regulon response regulator PhoB
MGTILVAEDDPVSLRFVVSLLVEVGYDVLEALDGESAVELAVDHRPDAIVTDLVMPYRDGFGVLRALRDREETRRIPILILSMRDREDDIVRGFEDGADDYVVKPFLARELIARVRKLVRDAGGGD